MSALKNWAREQQQILLTHLANRTFRNHPNLGDRLARRLLELMLGKGDQEDPELTHGPD